MIAHHSTVAHAAYHDLLRLLLDEQVSDLRGTPTKVERTGKIYWYDTYRIGSSVHKRYIGEDSDALRDRVSRHRELARQIQQRRKECARLVRILRAEGFMGIDGGTGSLLAAMAKAGVFRLGGTIVGTHAFRLYEGELGIRYSFEQLAQTGDIDIASFERLSLALEDVTSSPMHEVFSGFDFEPVPALDKSKVWRWQQSRSNQIIEFLTPSFDDEEDVRHLAAFGVDAQALHHLNYLLASPISAAVLYRQGVLVQIPRPERFAIHKLIVSQRRIGRDSLKSRKDLLQAEFLVSALAQDRPHDLHEAFREAVARGPKWRAHIEAALAKVPDVRSRLEALG
jgi:hypothetical protein